MSNQPELQRTKRSNQQNEPPPDKQSTNRQLSNKVPPERKKQREKRTMSHQTKPRTIHGRKRNNILYLALMAVSLLLIASAFSLPTRIAAAISPYQQIVQAWTKASDIGRYEYRSTAKQITYPAPALANIGRPPKEDNLAAQGQFDNRADELAFTFWLDGSFSPDTAIDIRSDGEKTWSRQGQGEWEEVQDVSGTFAPNGDPLAFLNGMRNIQDAGPDVRAFPNADIELVFQRYTFDFDGPAFGSYVTLETAKSMRQKGELPNGIQLDIPAFYAQATGAGEIWLDDAGLPARLKLSIDYGPQGSGELVTAHIMTDFFGYDQSRLNATMASLFTEPGGWLNNQLSPLQSADVQRSLLLGFGFSLFALLLMLVVVRFWRTREFRAALAFYLIVAMVVSPLLSAERVHAFGNAQDRKVANHEMVQAEAVAKQKALESLESTQFNPQADPLRSANELNADRVNAYSAASSVSASSTMASTQASTQTDTTDTDGDGLLDVQEIEWLTCVDADEDGVCDSDTTTDWDGDGLTDVQEVEMLGTVPTQTDSDGDGISDDLEIAGFTLNGTTWYLDPTEPDSNKDGVIDGLECFNWSEANPDFDAANPTGLGNCSDTDGDGTPDVFDEDNDGDGVHDTVDSSAFNVYTGYTEENPLEVSVANLTTDEPVLVTVELRPENAEELNYFGHVLDWPSEDRSGQIQRISNSTWQSTSVYTSTAPNATNGDVRLIPMLEISIPSESGHFGNLPVLDTAPIARSAEITVDTWLDSAALSGYGVMVLDVLDSNNDPTGDLVAYAPLMPFSNSNGDETAGYAAKMLYQPSQGTGTVADWGATHEYRLVWLVQMLTDPCPTDNADCDDDERLSDQYSVVHNYYEDWQLTGLSISEQHGLDATIIYEDPTVAGDVNYPEELYNLAWNLSESFVNGLDCGLSNAANGTCSSDSVRDVTVATMDSAISTWTSQAPAGTALVAETPVSYPHKDYLNEIAITDAKDLLINQFQTSYADKWPTLLFAYEYTERTVGLDEAQAAAGESPVFDMSAYDKTTTAGYNWGTYYYADGQWQDKALETYLGELDALLQTNEEYFTAAGSQDGLEDDEGYASAALGKRRLFQLFYATIYRGVSGLVAYHSDSTIYPTNAVNETTNFSDRWSISLPTTGANIAFAQGVSAEFVNSFGQALTHKLEGFDIRAVSAGNGLIQLEFVNEGKFWKAFGDAFGTERNPLVSSVDDVDFDFRAKFKGTVNGMTKAVGYVGAAMAVGAITAFVVQAACSDCAWAGVVINAVEVAANFAEIVSLLRAFVVLKNLEQGLSFAKTLTSIAGSSAGSAALVVVVAVITLAVLWTVYLVNYVDKGASFAKRMATAFTTAATIVTVVFTLIALVAIAVATTGVVGAVVALVVLVALAVLGFWEAVCGIDSAVRGDNACTGPISAFTEWVAEALTEVNDVIINMNSDDRLDIGFDEISLEYSRRGFATDNYLNYTLAVTNTLHTKDSYIDAIDARQANFLYSLQTNTSDPYPDLSIGVLPPCDAAHVGSCYDVLGQVDTEEHVYENPQTGETQTITIPIYGLQMNSSVTTTVDLSAYPGINRNVAENLYIGESFSIPFELCDTWLFGTETNCEFYGTKEEGDPGWNAIPLTAEQSYDILPATVADFVAGDWAATGTIAWPNQKDLDNDGRLSIDDGGEDPDDTDADMDDDGLTDGFELDANLDLDNADTDGDGLLDGEELRYNTSATTTDTDGDGLSDYEEVQGWLHTYDVTNNLETRVWSDPLSKDTDGDLLSDLQEFLLSFHPGVEDDPAVVDTLVEISEFDVKESAAPLAIWAFDEDEDAAAFVDRSGQGSTASCDSTTTCPTAGEEGRYGNALDFDGGDSLTAALATELADRSFTLSAWAKLEAGNASGYIISHASDELEFVFANDSTLRCKIPGATITAAVPSVDEWYHWACTYDAEGDTLTIYRDGSQVNSGSVSSDYSSSGTVVLGDGFIGLLDEVAIYGDVLSDDEIVGLASGGYNLDDGFVRAGAAVDYSVTLTNTASTDASGILVNELNTYDPLVEAPNVVLHMDATEVITTFVNSTNDTYAATCGIGTCPTPTTSVEKPSWGPYYGNPAKHNNNVSWSGQLMHFDGVDDAIALPELATGPTTAIAFWARLESKPGDKAYLLYSEPDVGYSLYVNSAGKLYFDDGQGATIVNEFDGSDITIEESIWYHYIVAPDNDSDFGDLIVSWPHSDGTQEVASETDKLAWINEVQTPQFGPGIIGNNADGDKPFHGQIAQFAYYQVSPDSSVGRDAFKLSEEFGAWTRYDMRENGIFEHGECGDGSCEVAPSLLLEFEDWSNTSLTSVRNSVNNADARCETTDTCPQTTSDAQYDEALAFDGDDYLTLDGIELDNRSFTIATWAKRDSTGNADFIIGQGEAVDYQGLHMGFRSNNRFTCAFYADDVNSPTAYTDSNWNHWVCSYDAATKMQRIFRNGILVESREASDHYQGSGPLYIGKHFDQRHFAGNLDEVMILPNAIDSEEGAQVLMGGTYPFSEIDRAVQTFTLPAGDSLVVSGSATLDDEVASQVQELWQQVDATLDGDVSSDAISATDLALYLPLDHNVDSTQMVDLANTPNGTCIVDCPTGGYMGPVERSAYFDGVDDAFYLDDVVPSSDQVTFSAWVKAKRGTLLDIRDMGTRELGDFIGWNGLEIDVDGAKLHGENSTIYVPYTLADNEWTHLAVVVDQPSDWEMTVYVNGAQVDQQTAAASEITSIGSGMATIGVQKNLAHLLEGQLDEVRLYSTAMSAAEVAAEYEESRPLLYLPLDEDESATSVASEFGGVGVPSSDVGLGADGRLDNAAYFDGESYITLDGVDALNAVDDAVTVMAWVKPEELTGRQRIISTGKAAARGWSFGLNGDKLRFTLFGVTDIDDSVVTINSDLWQHVAVTFDQTNGTQFYVNGALSGTSGGSSALTAVDTDPIYVGALTRNDDAPGEFFSGAIDEVVVYDRELTAEEVESAFSWQFRTYREVGAATFTVDADAPTVALASTATYREDYTTWLSVESIPSDAQLQVAALDQTSSIVRVEMGQQGPNDSSTAWYDAPACIDATADGHWCALFRPDGEGAYQMQFRAVDAVGNITTNSDVETIYVDSTPPVMTLDSSFTGLLDATRPDDAELRWILSLSGTVTDPVISNTSQAGSGLSADETAIVVKDEVGNVVGDSSQRVTVDESSGTWQVDFEFETNPPFGTYTVEAVAVDMLGNRIADDTQIGSFQLDERAPSAKYMDGSVDGLSFNTSLYAKDYFSTTIDTTGLTPMAISGTLSIGGLATSAADWPGASAFYHFEDADVAASIQDASGNSLTASCANCPSAVTGSSPYGQALSFDGVDDYVSVPHLHDPADGAFSAMAWFNVTDVTTGRPILQQADGSGSAGRTWLYVHTNGTLASFLGGSALLGSTTVTPGSWHHAAVTYDGTTLNLYLDGKLEKSEERSVEASDGEMLIGADKILNTHFYGSIDEVAIYSRSLLESQIYAAARQPQSTIASVEARLTKFDDGSSTTQETTMDWTAATLGSAASAITDWSFTVDDDSHEGYYKLEVRSSDSNGNVESGSTIWRGRIDRVTPAIAITLGDIVSDSVSYDFTVTDMILDADSLTHPCDSADVIETTWSNGDSLLDGATYELTASCTISYTDAMNAEVTACDAAGNCSTSDILDNPAFHLPLDEANLATTFADASGNGNDATCSSIECPMAGQPGQYGTAAYFDDDNYLTVPNVLNPAETPWTAAVWFKVTDLTWNRVILSQEDDISTGRTWLGVTTGGKIWSKIGGPGLNSTQTVTLDQWHHAAVTYDETTLRIYLDGQLEATLDVAAESNAGELYVGANKLFSNNFNGTLDAVVIYDIALSDAQVAELAADPDSSSGDVQITDIDADNVPDAIEEGAPNNGDGNGDGTLDSQQANVTSLPAASGTAGEYVTLAAPNGTELVNVSVSANAPATEPNGVTFPIGHLAFGVQNVAVGGAIQVTIFPADMSTINSYYKYGPTTDNGTDHWYEFLYDGTTGAEILADRIILHFVDGGRGDADLTANGVIVDPGAPALRLSPTALDEVDEPTQVNSTIFLPVISNQEQASNQVKAQSVDSNEGADTVPSLQPEEVTQQILLPIMMNQ
ncbi:MAG: LamG-like jellyroll fold domain-containing protein [Chloroflexota bacterium]